MLVAAAVCPHPPVLVPGLAGAADPLGTVREASLAAVRAILGAGADLLVVVGGGRHTREHEPAARGSLLGWGVDVRSPDLGAPDLGAPDLSAPALSAPDGRGETTLPLSLTVGRWLLERACTSAPDGAGAASALAMAEVAWQTPTAEAVALGAGLGARSSRVAMLVLGDGCARLGERSPGWTDPRAAQWDASCAAALGSGDPGMLAALDAVLAAELLTAGLPAWHVLAGAAAAAGDWRAQLTLHAAPLGVAYLVAQWRPMKPASGGSG